MCSVWQYSAHLTVAGLVSDLAGFSLLALDLLREYRRNRWHDTLVQGASAAEGLSRVPDETILKALEVTGPNWTPRRPGPIARDATGRAEVWELYQRVEDARSTFGYKPAVPPIKAADFPRLRERFFDALAARALTPVWRPPLVIGVCLILVGFALQIAGAWPC